MWGVRIMYDNVEDGDSDDDDDDDDVEDDDVEDDENRTRSLISSPCLCTIFP